MLWKPAVWPPLPLTHFMFKDEASLSHGRTRLTCGTQQLTRAGHREWQHQESKEHKSEAGGKEKEGALG